LLPVALQLNNTRCDERKADREVSLFRKNTVIRSWHVVGLLMQLPNHFMNAVLLKSTGELKLVWWDQGRAEIQPV